jgi:hypothetical protein
VNEATGYALKELLGRICRCGRRKESKKTFCPLCYSSLPEEMKKGLYKPLAEGYVAAYLTAWKWLEARG